MTDLFLRRDLHAARQRRARTAYARLAATYGCHNAADHVIVTDLLNNEPDLLARICDRWARPDKENET